MTASVLAGARPAATLVSAAAVRPVADVLAELDVRDGQGLTAAEAAVRLAASGPNAVVSHRVRAWSVLLRQMRSPLLGLLVAAAVASYAVGEQSGAVIIVVIVGLSVGLGFVNEFRAEKAAEALHSGIHHHATVVRDGRTARVDVVTLVPGDLVELRLGDIVPADVRLVGVSGLECDESVLTGESLTVEKTTAATAPGTPLAELSGCALTGTIVHAGSGRGVVVATGARTEFGAIATGLDTHQVDTGFQIGLRRFSLLLVRVAAALTTAIFAINVVLHRPILDALLFSLAIAVGITPQLLPAVVSTSLAAGSRRMRARKVLVKRLVCIEDLGDVDLLFTDKTGTLTAGRLGFMRAVGGPDALRWGLLATDDVGGGNPLDRALEESPASVGERAAVAGYARISALPFDHDRRMVSVLVRDPSGQQTLVTKGAPETVLDRCTDVSDASRAALATEFDAGNRVVAVATRAFTDARPPTVADEQGLHLEGLLVFLDPPRADAAAALSRLGALGVEVKVVTGDNAAVAVTVCGELGLRDVTALTGAELDALDDAALAAAIAHTTVFARVSPEHKARIVRVRREAGAGGVAFLGDGVNDALALHAADVGISVDSATDVAKDAADVILLDKDLHVLADGVTEGRRIFANTLKYVLMGTSSNFGNMFSAAGASLFLSFLPMLPSQILLNNLLYDTSQLAIPTDNVDEEQLRRPSHWDIAFIRRFMLVFGPLSSLFDFATFGVMLWVFHSGPEQFRTGWFVESLATQTLVIFAIRTRRVPLFRSHPSIPMVLAALGVVTVGAVLPATSLAHALGFTALPGDFFIALGALAVAYLVLIELGKRWFYGAVPAGRGPARRQQGDGRRRLRRRAAHLGRSTGR